MISLPRLTIHKFFHDFYKAAHARNSPGHWEQMRLSLDRLREFHEADVFLDELSIELIDGFRQWRSTPGSRRFVQAATLNKDLRNLRAIANFAHRRRRLPEQIFFEFDTEQVDEPLAWFPEELAAIFQAAARKRGTIGATGISAAHFWQALPAVVYSTGARIGAVMQLCRESVDLDRGWVTLKWETQKQKKSQVIQLHPETIAALRSMWLPERALLFPWPFDQSSPGWPTLGRHLKKLLQSAGLPFDAKRLWHCFRKTNGTYCMASAGDIAAAQKQLGHSSPAVTRRYIDPRHINQASACNLIPPPPLSAAAEPVDPQLRLF